MAISMHGLDLSFLKSKESQDQLRWMRNRAIEAKRRVPLASKRSDLSAPHVMGDIRPFVSPVGATPEVISSRSTLRAHERKHGVYQCGDIPQGTFTGKADAKKAQLEEAGKGVSVEWV